MSDFAKDKDVPDKNVGDTISRQAAVDSAKEGLCDFFGLHADDIKFPITNTDYLVLALNKNITSRINSLPSAEPEVISCLDCIHYTPLGIDKSWGRCAIHSSPTENQRMCQSCDFCAWAERKADE